MGRRCAQLAGYSLADWASGAIHRFPRPHRKVVGWNAGANAEMIQAMQISTLFPARPYPSSHRHCNGARLAREESVGANPEFCQGLQIAPVSARDGVFLAP